MTNAKNTTLGLKTKTHIKAGGNGWGTGNCPPGTEKNKSGGCSSIDPV